VITNGGKGAYKKEMGMKGEKPLRKDREREKSSRIGLLGAI
jgi:hypothetical protein